MHLRVYLFFISVITLLSACTESIVEPDDLGFDYFPLEQGRWITYQVDSVVHDHALNIHNHFSFQVKEVVDSAFIDNEGETAYRMERFKRPDDSFPWTLSDVWTIKRNNARAERVEENIRTIRLTFPIREGKTWDFNAENTNDIWQSEILTTEASFAIDENEFDDVCEVSYRQNLNLADAEICTGIYARDIGLIYFRLDTVRFNTFPFFGGEDWEDEDIDIGREIEMQYLDHGIE